MTYERTYKLICDSIDSLQRSGVINSSVEIFSEAVMLGTGSELDSLGFVSLISDIEERISIEEGMEVYLVLDDIGDFNLNNPSLTIKALASYLVELTSSNV